MNPFQQWLDGPQDYEAGRQLYSLHGPNFILKRTLSHGPNAYNTSALREELTRLARAGHVAPAAALPAAAPVVVVSVIAAPAPAPAASPAPATEQLLVDLDKQWKPLYKDAGHLQGQLEHAPDKDTACAWAHRILDLMDDVQASWETQAYVRAHGQLPAPPEVVTPPALDLTDRAAVLRRRNGLRSQISKQKRNAARASEVEAWKAEVAELDKVLEAFKSLE